MISEIGSYSPNKRKWFSILVPLVISGALAAFCIYARNEYGIALFLLVPFFIGAAPTILYARKYEITRALSIEMGFITLGLFALCLFAFAIEGAICIIMALPIGALAMWIGCMIGLAVCSRSPVNAEKILIFFLCCIPLTSFIENKTDEKQLLSVTTSVTINAPPERVWANVIKFPQLKEPTEFLFKTGISYPINATITGEGIGAIRHCNFSTGTFVEPITVWNKPALLRFSVAQCPPPMKEISFWDINAPHLHDYFVSEQGQFKLTKLAGNKTLLEGTTWYYHKIKPAFYWQVWSNYIVHKIHQRVLDHIKTQSELPQ